MTRLARMNRAAEEFRATDPKDWEFVAMRLHEEGMLHREIYVAQQDATAASCQHKEIDHTGCINGPRAFELLFKCRTCGIAGSAVLPYDAVEW